MDARYAVGNGYGESKYVAERVSLFRCQRLALKFSSESDFQILTASDLNATSLRIGQLTGGYPNGAWATTDWFPIMIKSSLELGALPTAQGVSSI